MVNKYIENLEQSELKTLDDDIDLSTKKGSQTYDLLMHPPSAFDMTEEEIIHAINTDIPYRYDDYTWAIPKNRYIYFINAYLEGKTYKIPKKNYKELFKLPRIEFYSVNESEAKEEIQSGIKFHKNYFKLSKDMQLLSLNYAEDELLFLLHNEKEFLDSVINRIENNECGTKTIKRTPTILSLS